MTKPEITRHGFGCQEDEAAKATNAMRGSSRRRRHDPNRRSRIIDETLFAIAEDGVAGTTHRNVAQRADVPLGSMTYYFASLDDLLLEALTIHASRILARYSERLVGETTLVGLVEALLDLIHQDLSGIPHEGVLTLELYALAARKPEFRTITRNWLQQARQMLERFVDADTASAVAALMEGWLVSRSIEQSALTRASTALALRRLLALNT